jgi:hypothetical protein
MSNLDNKKHYYNYIRHNYSYVGTGTLINSGESRLYLHVPYIVF